MVRKHVVRLYRENAPTRESLAKSRILQPVAHRVLAPELWRFTRRSVPRGVALGLLVGIFLLIPGIQIAGAALLALPLRANIPLAAAMTFLSNPATTPLIVVLSFYVGNMLLGRTADVSHLMALINHHAGPQDWLNWLVSETAPALLFGLSVVSVVTAAIGYVLADMIWRLRVGRKWARRSSRQGQPADGEASVSGV
jgi:uncharacterized protein (DUF2062 family)